MNGELQVAFDTIDFLAVFPLKEGVARGLVGTLRDEAGQKHENLTWSDISTRVLQWMRIGVDRVNWFSTYRACTHRVADHFP